MPAIEGNDLGADLDAFLRKHENELIEFRRDLHAHPELAGAEHRTTRRVALRLAAAGLQAGDPAQGHRPDRRHRHAG